MLASSLLRKSLQANAALGVFLCSTVGMPVLLLRGAVHAMREMAATEHAYKRTLHTCPLTEKLPRYERDRLFHLHMQYYYERKGVGARGHAFARLFWNAKVRWAAHALEDIYAISLLALLAITLGRSLPF